jgi:hypothetical protein
MVQLSIKEVETRLGEVKCAICKGNRFGIDSRTVTTGDGDWKAICLDCHYTFPVYTDMEFYLQLPVNPAGIAGCHWILGLCSLSVNQSIL